MKKILTMAISLLMIFSVAVVANAESVSDCITNKYNNEPTAFSVFDYAENVTKTECIPIKGSSQTYTELCCEVTDAAVIQRLYEQGVIERNKDGTLPKKVSLTQLVLDDQKELQETKGGITISKTNYYDGRYFDEYDRYVVSGPCEFTQVYSRTSTASWNTSMSGSVNVGGTVYGIADVRASVSASMGYTIGNSYTKDNIKSEAINIK